MTSSDSPLRCWTKRIAIVALIGAAFLLLRMTLLTPKPIEIRVAAVHRGRVEATVTNSKAGTIKSRKRSRLSAETGGRVIEILHREGDVVEAGTILIQLDDATPKVQVELAQASLQASIALRQEACLNRDHAARDLERNKQLAEQNVVSQDVLDRLRVVFKTAKATCNAALADQDKARANLRNAHVELGKTRIRAPFAGVIAEVTTEVGEWVTPSPPLLSSPPVVDLIDLNALYVSAPMDEVDSGRIQIGQPVKITVDSRQNHVFSGTVKRVAPYVLDLEAQNRTVEVEVEFEPPEQARGLLPGTSADVEIILHRREDVLRIPSSAIFEQSYVLVDNDGILEKHKITTGLHNWDYTEVQSGLQLGERVVTSLDRKEVKEGARVHASLRDESTASP